MADWNNLVRFWNQFTKTSVSPLENVQIFAVDQRKTSIAVTIPLTAVKAITKEPSKRIINLAELLQLAQFLLANTYAIQTSSKNHFRSLLGEAIKKWLNYDLACSLDWVIRQNHSKKAPENSCCRPCYKLLGRGLKMCAKLWLHVCDWI